MRHLALATALLLGSPVLTLARAQERPAVSVENFGTVSLSIDFEGHDPHLASESLWLRRSDDGDVNNKVLEQWSSRSGRWKDSAKTQAFFPSESRHDQFDTDALPFTKDFFRELNSALAGETLAQSAKLGARDGDEVSFTLAWNPKGHLGSAKPAQLTGRLARSAGGRLSFSPTDATGKKIKPLLDLLLDQLEKTNEAQDETRSAVLLFGKVDANGKLEVGDTSWSCALDGARAKTASPRYAVSADTEASLRRLLTKLDGKSIIVRAVLSEPGDKQAAPSAKVVGVLSTIGWKEPILSAPTGGREFASGKTLANLTDDEARELVSGQAHHGVLAEITSMDASSGLAAIRAPNRKGSKEPNKGYVKQHGLEVFTADGEQAEYGSLPLDEALKLAGPSATPGVTGRLR